MCQRAAWGRDTVVKGGADCRYGLWKEELPPSSESKHPYHHIGHVSLSLCFCLPCSLKIKHIKLANCCIKSSVSVSIQHHALYTKDAPLSVWSCWAYALLLACCHKCFLDSLRTTHMSYSEILLYLVLLLPPWCSSAALVHSLCEKKGCRHVDKRPFPCSLSPYTWNYISN